MGGMGGMDFGGDLSDEDEGERIGQLRTFMLYPTRRPAQSSLACWLTAAGLERPGVTHSLLPR